jgi:sigma-B regulation protein RsbU (phosphoserine phosphatase)
LSLAVGIKDEQVRLILCASALLRQDRRLAVFRRSSLYTTYLIDARGVVLAHTDATLVTKRENLASSPFIQNVLASKVAKGVSEYLAADGRARMIAYKKLGVGGLVAVAEIPKDRAFLASRRLIEKSALFGVLILCLGFIVSIVFSRRLTAALQRLYLATERVARGDFQVEVQATSEDEVGALSRSFNHMTKEITRLLVETADKARMEKELETAQLVQDNFFPKGDQTFAGYEVSAYFRPASECGGDWWGRFQVGSKLVLLIGDATGHGVPAALITAAAHSCATTLARVQEKIAGVELSPSFVLEMLNAAIFHAGQGRVKMTFFAAVIDTATGAVRYANASHDLPLVGRAGDDAAFDVDSFATRPDPCLGESLTTKFAEHEAGLSPGDALVLYTDGLSECRNAAGEEFGERRLVRGLKKLGQHDAAGIKSQIVADVRAFAGKDAVDDDLTLVVVRRPASAGFGTERQAG